MYITCLDVEGVLVPEIWIAFAEASGIPELKKTTRDEPDYDKLMNWRLSVLKEHGLGLKEIQKTIAKIDPLPGAKKFLDELRTFSQVILISDTCSTLNSKFRSKVSTRHLWPVSVSKVMGLIKFTAFFVISTWTLAPCFTRALARFAIL